MRLHRILKNPDPALDKIFFALRTVLLITGMMAWALA